METVQDPAGSPYKIQWLTPYSLVYALLGGCWALFGPMNAGRAAMLVIGILWITAIHLTAYHRNRPSAGAVLASMFFFSHLLYWGFYSFVLGLPAFLVWFHVSGRTPSREFSLREAAVWLGAGLLLYFTHVLWFLAGVAWLLIRSAVLRVPVRSALLRLSYVLPVLVLVGIWLPLFSGSAMAGRAMWWTIPPVRLFTSWLPDAALGGLRGPVEYVFLCVVGGWILLAVWQNRKDLGTAVDRELLLAAIMFFLFAVLLPGKFMTTIRFAQRWAPVGMIMLILAMPVPRIKPYLAQVAALIVVGTFCAVTCATWIVFEQKEMSGLEDALQALPERQRVIGLDMVGRSELIESRPFIQVFAYAQVLRGGRLNFSFAEFVPSLTVYKEPFKTPWTHGLEWYPHRVKKKDLKYFDYALINGSRRIHDISGSMGLLVPVTHTGRWRLYRVTGFER